MTVADPSFGVLDRLVGRMPGTDEKGLLLAATQSFVELLGDEGACVRLDPRPRIVVSTGHPLAEGDDIDLEPEVRRALETRALVTFDKPGFGTIAILPLVLAGRRFGALVARARGRRTLSEAQCSTARLLGSMTALLLADREDQEKRKHAGEVDRSVTPVFGVELAAQAPKRILVVEDDPDIGPNLGELLSGVGYQVTVVKTGAEGTAEALRTLPAMVLLDVCLPDRDGFVVAADLAGDRRTSALPILFLSARDDLASRVRQFHAGEADFLRKPFTVEELLTRVDQCLVRAERRNRLRRKAQVDELTGLGNLRLLEERLSVESSRIERYGTALTAVMIDVDGLKAINDRHGHLAGSAVLRAVGEALNGEVRSTDVATRYGGDEFAVILPHTGVAEGIAFSERVLARIRLLHPCGIAISVSMGVASYDRATDGSVQKVLERADAAAYRAKQQGGNRVCHDPPTRDVSAA